MKDWTVYRRVPKAKKADEFAQARNRKLYEAKKRERANGN